MKGAEDKQQIEPIEDRAQFSIEIQNKQKKQADKSTVLVLTPSFFTDFVITYLELIRITGSANASSSTMCISPGAYAAPCNTSNRH